MPLDIVTFGCRLNVLESEAIRRHAEAAGLDDAIIVNTCAVTSEAERQARQAIRKLRRERPGARLIVTGCAAQIDPARFAAMPEVDTVLGNEEKLRADSYRDFSTRVSAGDIFAARETAPHLVDGFDGRARGLRPGATRLRPSLHVLRHSLWARRQPLDADRGDHRSGASPGRRAAIAS